MNFLDLFVNHCPAGLIPFRDQNIHIIEGISNFLEQKENEGALITPSIKNILSTFNFVSLDPDELLPNSLKVVFLFQDPYPKPGAACGIATCTINGYPQPTYKNMMRRLKETYGPMKDIDLNNFKDVNGDNRSWCTQGVLMLNAALTTEENQYLAHEDEWRLFTQQLIKWLSDTFPFLIFVMFGRKAQFYSKCISGSKHIIMSTSHPADRGYESGFGASNIFNDVNEYLILNKRDPIKWEEYKY